MNKPASVRWGACWPSHPTAHRPSREQVSAPTCHLALTAIGAPMHAGAGQLQAQLVHTPAVTTALVTLHLPVVAILVTARDEDSWMGPGPAGLQQGSSERWPQSLGHEQEVQTPPAQVPTTPQAWTPAFLAAPLTGDEKTRLPNDLLRPREGSHPPAWRLASVAPVLQDGRSDLLVLHTLHPTAAPLAWLSSASNAQPAPLRPSDSDLPSGPICFPTGCRTAAPLSTQQTSSDIATLGAQR